MNKKTKAANVPVHEMVRRWCPICESISDARKITTGYRYEWICPTCGCVLKTMSDPEFRMALQLERAEENAMEPPSA